MRAKLLRLITPHGNGHIAKLTGIRASRLYKIIRGDGDPYARELYALAAVFGVTLDFLMDDSQETFHDFSPDQARILWLMDSFDVPADSIARAIMAYLVKTGQIPERNDTMPSIGLPGRLGKLKPTGHNGGPVPHD
jgi:transcriptional regulator with XRE-family HTH domain